MARQEQDREDLLAEATALTSRCELAFSAAAPSIVLGFRNNGCLSIYFSPERAFHFNTRGELRRAHHESRMFKAEQSRLVSLTRDRTGNQVALVSHRLSDEEQSAFLGELTAQLNELVNVLSAGAFTLIGEVPSGAGVCQRVAQWIEQHAAQLRVADSPRVG